jgi:FMN phosphatase YigB (HAD superfamily)
MLRAIIFDLDGTLLDWSGFDGDWESMARERLKPVYAFLAGGGHKLPEFSFFVNDINTRSMLSWQSFKSGNLDAPCLPDVVRGSLAGFDLDMASIDVDEVLHHYPWGQVPGSRLFPEAKPILETLREAGLRLGLLTNAFQPMWMRDKELRELGIEDCFDCRTSAADVGKLKPHPLPFESTLKCLNATVESAVFVGDSLSADIVGAQGIGMRAVWRQNGRKDIPDDAPTPDAAISTLDDLLLVLDGWFPGWRSEESNER